MKRICRYFSVPVLLLGCFQLANAQSVVDVNIGFGAAQDKAASGLEADTGNFGVCTSATVNCIKTPKLNSFFMGFGANLMLWNHFGVGMEATLQPGKQTFARLGATGFGQNESLQTRVTFYDFNGIYQPINKPKATVQLVGGFGGTNVKFYDSLSGSGSVLGSANSSQYFSSSNHFQLHAGVGVQLYVKDKIFVRPQFDIHYVPNFTQFGRNLVTQEMVWIGYTIGDRQ